MNKKADNKSGEETKVVKKSEQDWTAEVYKEHGDKLFAKVKVKSTRVLFKRVAAIKAAA